MLSYPILCYTITLLYDAGLYYAILSRHTPLPRPGSEHVRPVRLLRVWISEGLTQADS